MELFNLDIVSASADSAVVELIQMRHRRKKGPRDICEWVKIASIKCDSDNPGCCSYGEYTGPQPQGNKGEIMNGDNFHDYCA